MYKILNFLVICIAVLGLTNWSSANELLDFGFAQGPDYSIKYGHINVSGINNGNLQLHGVTWCKKYFDMCLFREEWNGPFMSSRETVSPTQFVTMQTSVTNPEIVSIVQDGEMYRITFIYDQQREHDLWIPQYKEKK